MTDPLSADALMAHVRALAYDIGPRPAGHPAEARARDYIRSVLNEIGFPDRSIEELPFRTWDTWGYSMVTPALVSLAGNALSLFGRAGKLIGAVASLFSTYHLWRTFGAHKQPMSILYPKRPTANLIVRIPPLKEQKQRVVLLGHTDTNKARGTFTPARKGLLRASVTLGMALFAINGLAQLAQAVGGGRKPSGTQGATMFGLVSSLALTLHDEKESYIDGANDNATAVACLLGLGQYLKQNPLQHTEVWLAFTSAEEVGCLGTHALLDAYGSQLADAWFIDIEMVGTRQIAYVTHHSGLSHFNTYTPDEESLALVERTSAQHPEWDVQGQPMVIVEEVGSLRGRGYRGICLVGVGEDGWLANWHQYSDDIHHVEPAGMERAARFALEMMRNLDR